MLTAELLRLKSRVNEIEELLQLGKLKTTISLEQELNRLRVQIYRLENINRPNKQVQQALKYKKIREAKFEEATRQNKINKKIREQQEREEQVRIYERIQLKKIEEEQEAKINAYHKMISDREARKISLQDKKIREYQSMMKQRQQERDSYEESKIYQYRDMMLEREYLERREREEREERKIREAIQDQKIIEVYDKANDTIVYMTAEQYEDYIIWGSRYNIYETKPGPTFVGIGGESINKGKFGHDGGIIASTCVECGHIFYYTYRAPASRYRARCAHCEDWTKKYPLDKNYVRI